MLNIIPSSVIPRYAFTSADEVFIDRRQYHYFESRGNEHFFFPADGNGAMQSFNNSQIARWLDKGKFEHKPAPSSDVLSSIPTQMLSLFSPKEKRRAAFREAIVLAFLEKYRAGEVQRTDASIGAAMGSLRLRAGEIMAETLPSGLAATCEVPCTFGARSLRRWATAYERFGIAALYDCVAERGNRDRRITDDERCLMYSTVAGYLSSLKKTPANIVTDVQAAFTAENAQRELDGRPKLLCPSRVTIRTAIHQLDPLRVKLSREGKDAARRAYSPVGGGIDVERPMQRVEMDEQKIDVITLMGDAGLLDMLTDAEKRSLGLDGAKKRWWMTVALCVRTRCIVGMTLSRSPTHQSGLRTVEMATRDKGLWADAVGAEEGWSEGGRIGTLVTDCGKQFVGHEFRARMHDLGVNVLHTPAAAPWLKPYIERVFRTFSTRVMPRLSGCTFGDIIRKGANNPKANAALSVEDLCAVLVRWIVDVYHNTPHDGLDGETPRNCWRRLSALYGVTPPPSLPCRRLIFGQELPRVLQKDGVTVLGVRYHSKKLAKHLIHSEDLEVNVRWYPEDIGEVWVEAGGEWLPAKAHPRFQGVTAQQWLIARRELRARHAREAEIKMPIVQRALDFVERQNGEAMKRVGTVFQDWSKERIEREEREFFMGFRIAEDDEDTAEVETGARWGDELSTGKSARIFVRDQEKFSPPKNNPSAQCALTQPPKSQPLSRSQNDEDDNGLITLWDK